MTQEFDNVIIEAISACVPKNKVDNLYFDDILDSKEIRKFEKTTGIINRRYANKDITASDLGYKAAKKILEDKKCSESVTTLIFLSQTPDYKIPFTSNILQDRLGLSQTTLCLDINAGCAGFVQGLSVAYSIASNSRGKVLLVIAETLSKILTKEDRSTSMLFGDAATAILISKDTKQKEKSFFSFHSDGKNFDAIKIPEGGYRYPFNKNSIDNKSIYLKMDGSKVFDFTLREIPKSIECFFESSKLKKEKIDYFLFHQSNKFIIKQIASKLSLDKDKVLLNIDRFGNTSGVSIPLLIVTELKNLNKDLRLLCTGYGSGLNWGNTSILINAETKIYNLIEY